MDYTMGAHGHPSRDVDISEVYYITWNEDDERVCTLRRTVMVHGVEEVVYERSLTDE